MRILWVKSVVAHLAKAIHHALLNVDLHVVVIVAIVELCAFLVLPARWALVVIAAIPQFPILTHANDLRKFRHDAAGYIVANEGLVVLVVAVTWLCT